MDSFYNIDDKIEVETLSDGEGPSIILRIMVPRKKLVKNAPSVFLRLASK